MPGTKTDGNQTGTPVNDELLARLDHLDQLVHEIHAAIVPHSDALRRAAAMLDRGKGVRDWIGGKKS